MTNSDIKITPVAATAVVRAGGAVIGETANALRVTVGGAEPVYYFPRNDIGMMFLDQNDQRMTDPDLGEAVQFDIVTKSTTIKNAAWSFDRPASDAASLRSMLAFDEEKAVVEVL
jgi:uncharacterized protein (DUF427 family)